MNIAAMVDAAFRPIAPIFAHQGAITLSDSSGVSGSLELAAELAADATSASVQRVGGNALINGQRAPSGLAVSIGGDSYALTADAEVVDGAITLAITPAATTTYAAATAVTLADSVTWDLVALGAQLEPSESSRKPGMAGGSADHASTVYVLKSKLSGQTASGLREKELTIDGASVPVHAVLDEDPFWALQAGSAP